jgi:hypothetical protein
MIRDLWDGGWLGRTMLIGLPALVVLFVLFVLGAIAEQREWDRFSVSHHCHVTGKMRGDLVTTVAPIIGGNGGVAVGVSNTPDKTGYLCDDGVTYWR